MPRNIIFDFSEFMRLQFIVLRLLPNFKGRLESFALYTFLQCQSNFKLNSIGRSDFIFLILILLIFPAFGGVFSFSISTPWRQKILCLLCFCRGMENFRPVVRGESDGIEVKRDLGIYQKHGAEMGSVRLGPKIRRASSRDASISICSNIYTTSV